FYSINTGVGYSLPANAPTRTTDRQIQFNITANRMFDWHLDGKPGVLMRGFDADDTRPSFYYNHPLQIYTVGRGLEEVPIVNRATRSGSDLEDFVVLDANGDGLEDVLIFQDGTFQLYIRQGAKPDLLRATTGNLSPPTTVTYKVAGEPDFAQQECQYPIHC